jgi:hypothetical protein
VGKRTTVNTKGQKSEPSMRELTEKSARIKSRLNRRASSLDADTQSLLAAFRNVGKQPLASVGWIMAMALTVVPARSSLPLWLKIAASTAREVLANPKPAPTRTSTPRASRPRASSLEH